MRQVYLVASSTGRTGLGTYARMLSKQLPVRVLWTSSSLPATPVIDVNAVFSKSPIIMRLPRDGLVHCSDQQLAFPLFYQRRKSVVTVHDVIPLARQDEPFARRWFYRLIYQGIRHASHVIADSEHTKRDAVQHLRIPERQVSVVPLGVDHNVFFPSHAKREPATLLYVGSEMPRKNVKNLLHALALVQESVPDAQLVKIGEPQWRGGREQLLSLARRLGVSDSVHWIDSAENVADWYRKASVFVFPSLYEGFGLPVLEAMACGTPVVSSNLTSLPEITEDAALLCEPTPRNLADHILAVLNDKVIATRLSRRGVRRARQFSWERTAMETQAVYDKVWDER
ncbi:glycosyltransferase family 4 protein [Candidatus Woesearchaeota archaeon]|nr:glycosyltransferase family 4 protein [Candidatus Woesearchaeota archaeon]